uniref:VPS37 C-terminal domain-containing protein n=1 Tax=Timema monikensis TaxID=170555 RepID=A0A7R9EG31_9NEOP|nr:unnamed protein product [Timema monikensis]
MQWFTILRPLLEHLMSGEGGFIPPPGGNTRRVDSVPGLSENIAHVTEVQEDLEYKVDFLAGGVNMVLLVSLSPDFPLDKPVLKVQPLVIHPWVNDHSEIVSAPGLLNYTVHSDLGRVVQAIISEFSRNPPPVALGNEPQGSLPPLGGSEVSTDQSSSLARFPQVTGSYMGVYPPQSPVHTVNTLTFPELLDLTTEELRTLNNSEDRQQDWVESMPQCARLNAELDALIERTQELAGLSPDRVYVASHASLPYNVNHRRSSECTDWPGVRAKTSPSPERPHVQATEENLRKKPELSRLRKETEGKLATVKSLKSSFDSLSQEFQRRSEIYAPENIRRSLQLSALRSDEETESIAEHFLSGDMDVDHFTHLYIDKRMTKMVFCCEGDVFRFPWRFIVASGECAEEWLGHEKITEYDIAELLNKAFMKIATMEKAVSGFRSAGIFPLNPDKFNEEDFAPASKVRQFIVEASTESGTPISARVSDPELQPTYIDQTRPQKDCRTDGHPYAQPVQDPVPSTSRTNLFFTISPIPETKIEKQVGLGRKLCRKQHSEILTSSPVKRKLEVAQEKKRIIEEKKSEIRKKSGNVVRRCFDQLSQHKKSRGKKKIKKQRTSVSSEVDGSTLRDDEMDKAVLAKTGKEPNELCFICGEVGRDKELWYRCVSCSSWNHAECTGVDTPKDYLSQTRKTKEEKLSNQLKELHRAGH